MASHDGDELTDVEGVIPVGPQEELPLSAPNSPELKWIGRTSTPGNCRLRSSTLASGAKRMTSSSPSGRAPSSEPRLNFSRLGVRRDCRGELGSVSVRLVVVEDHRGQGRRQDVDPPTGLDAISAITPRVYDFPNPCTPNRLMVLQPFRSTATLALPNRPTRPNWEVGSFAPK